MPSGPPTLPPISSLGIDLSPIPRPNHTFSSSSDPAFPHITHMDVNSSTVHNSHNGGNDVPTNLAGPGALEQNEGSHNGEDNMNEYGSDNDDDDDGEDDDGGDDDDDDDGMNPYPWQPLIEDTSIPCEDELEYIRSKEEFSAGDHAHWEQETFFDLPDPDLKPGASGRIEWTVPNFNGTRELPNRTLLMKSPIVHIGGYEWQIKFYPQGNRTEFLSVYLENVTMTKKDFVDQLDLKHPPLPVLAGSPRPKRRISLAAQVAVIMYNPSETRVYEFKSDAHQFHKQSADFGWKYFTKESRSRFYKRTHGQRQAILRNDTLAFNAYIRIIDDPTGCMWDTASPSTELSRASSTLARFDGVSARVATLIMLFHLPPVRKWLYTSKSTSARVLALQVALDRFLGRRLKRRHIKHQGIPSGCDVVSVMHALVAGIKKEDSQATFYELCSILNCFAGNNAPVAQHRLETKDCTTLQQALDKLDGEKTPEPIMAFELQRQFFNRENRRWEKIVNPVFLEDKITYGHAEYQLYCFITHAGRLGSKNYGAYVRPNGLRGLWYAYQGSSVTCLTNWAAKLHAQGKSAALPVQASVTVDSKKDAAIAYLAVYVRSDWSTNVFAAPAEEAWNMSSALTAMIGRPHHRRDAKPETARHPLGEVKMALANSTLIQESLNRSNPLYTPPHESFDEDLIMSDVEDNVPVASHLYKFLSEGFHTETKCVDYFSGEWFYGSVNATGKYHGKGHLIRANGDEYKGQFDNGQFSGAGVMIYGQTGNTYDGSWLEGQHNGQGSLVEKESGNIFEGGWKDGRKHGAFVLRGTMTDDDKQYCQICFEREMNIAFVDCGHVLVCKVCAAAVQQCPLCRKQVLARLELFGVKVSVQ